MKIVVRFLLALILCKFLFTSSAQGSVVVGWGTDGSGEIDVPAGLTNAVAIAAGLNCSLTLNSDNTVTNWGATYAGPPMPADLTNVAAISGEAAHDVIIRSDGTVAAWGEGFSKSFVPAGLSNMVAAATGFEHSLVLKADSTVFGWGGSPAGDDGAHIVPDGLSNVVAIAAGGYFSLALKGDGTVTPWGDDFWGETDLPADVTNVVAIACGGYHGVALKCDGTVSVWGDDSAGQLDQPPDLTNVVAIAAGWYHTLALKADGTIVSWGYNFAGQTNVPEGLSNVVAIAGGFTHNLAIVSSNEAAVVFQSPLNQTAVAGDSVLFRSSASGTWPVTQQWQFNGTNLDGRNNSMLLLTNVQPSQAGIYLMTATNSFGGAQSSSAILTVLPFILTSPADQTRYVGDNVSINVGLRGVGPFAFQWQCNGTNLLNETNAMLVLANANTNQTGNYSVVVSNLYGTIQSSNAAIIILDSAPFVVTASASVVTWPGATVSFQIVADGTKPIYYQWQTNNVPLVGATNATLTLAGVATNQAGFYSVTVSNVLGKFTTANVALTLVPVAAWGGNNGNVTNLPVALTNTIAVAAGGYSHGLALKPNGTVFSWGLLTSVPSNVTNVAAIAAASYQSLALRSNGTVAAWNTITTVPANVSNVAAIAVGGYSSGLGCFVVKSNGTVQAWGLGTTGLTNVPAGLNGVIDLAAGKYHALALRGDGRIIMWADSADSSANVIPTNVTDVIAVSARGQHSLALKADGTVAAWGSDPYGETDVPAGLSNVVAVAASEENSIALKQDGNVVIWGRNNFGQTNILAGVSNVVQISGGLDYNLFELGGTQLNIIRQPHSVVGLPRQQVLLSIGLVSQNPFTAQWQFNGTNLSGATNVVLRIPSLSKADQGNYRILLTTGSGTVTSVVAQVTMTGNSVVAWGINSSGQTNVPPGLNAVAVGGGIGHSLALLPGGTVVAWGTNANGVTNVPAPVLRTNVIAIAAGTRHNLVLQADGKVYAWGTGANGVITVPSGLSNVLAVAAGDRLSLALKSDGLTTQWGSIATAPANLNNVVSVAAGYSHALAGKSDGSVVTWGGSAPAVPLSLSNVISVAAGNNFSLALTTNGTVSAWGDDTYGQCNVPADLSNVVAIAAGGYAGLALKSDGTLATWGRNFAGLTNPPAGLSNVVAIAGGDLHSLAVIGSSDAPTIVRQPTPVYFANVFDRVLLSVGAVSANAMNYQWRLNGTNLPGATNAIFYLPLAHTNDNGTYSVAITNALGSVVSSNALLAVITRPPIILSQPTGQTNIGGATAVFQISADGTVPLAYQWRKNNLALADATNTSLTLANLRRTNEGVYTVVVTNGFGAVSSSNATLRVLVPQHLRSPVLNPDGPLSFLFSDSDGGMLTSNDAPHFAVAVSTNLTDWGTLPDAPIFTNSALWFLDTAATNLPRRYYRVMESP